MRPCFLAFILLTCFSGFCSQQPVQWQVFAKQRSNQHYTITIKGSIDPGWHLYAQTSLNEGLESVGVKWENDNINARAELISLTPVIEINDSIFNLPLKVYTGVIELEQEIVINGIVPGTFFITIFGYVADGSSFLPVLETIPVPLEGGITAGNSFRLPTVDLQSEEFKSWLECGFRAFKNKGLTNKNNDAASLK